MTTATNMEMAIFICLGSKSLPTRARFSKIRFKCAPRNRHALPKKRVVVVTIW